MRSVLSGSGFPRILALGLAAVSATLLSGFSPELAKVNIGVQQSGTVQWELTAMHNLKLDEKHHLDLQVRQLADNQAGQVALQTGTVDIILSDFVWVSLQRHQGNMVTMVPHSLAVGGLMIDPASGIKSVADLKGQTIAVAGTPVDKSWVVLQAYYNKLTGGNLANDASIKFGAPPLINQLLSGGQVKAALNNWNWNVRTGLEGKQQLISVAQMLSDLGVSEQPPLLGWVFTDADAEKNKDGIKAFLDASFDTKKALLTDDKAWEGLQDVMGVKDDQKLFIAMRDAYRQGIVKSYIPTKMDAAAQSYALLAKFGGKDVVGDADTLADGTFYKGYRK
jgi:NitT/TauT family transport system substrate-binding protein